MLHFGKMFLWEAVAFLSGLYFGYSAELPPFITKCPLGLPEVVEQCALGQAKAVLKQLKDGYPPFDIPPLDPFIVPSLDLLVHEALNIKLKDLKVEGLTSASYTRLLPTFQDNEVTSVEVSLEIPNLHISGWHITKGFFFTLPVDTHGKAAMDFGDVKINLKINLRTDIRNGFKYYQVPRNFDVVISVGTLHADIDDSDNNAPENLDFNLFVNEFPTVFLEMVMPSIEDAVRDVTHSILLKVATQVPAENFFAT